MKRIIIESEDGSQRRGWLRDDVADAIMFLVGKMTQEIDSTPPIHDAREATRPKVERITEEEAYRREQEKLLDPLGGAGEETHSENL
jgi:hypothetical protein